MYPNCEHVGVLNMLLVLNVTVFWTYHSFKYARVIWGSKYA